jgi:uncharacterized protein (UPF0262 family)
MHGLIFKPTKSKKHIPVVKPQKRIVADYKIIRNINIIALASFSYSHIDSIRKSIKLEKKLETDCILKQRNLR